MAWTESDLTAIESSIKAGVLRVQFGDRMTQYRSLDEMLKIRDLIRKDLGLAAGTRRRKYFVTSKGLTGAVDTADE